jgi:hypothetical protein
MKKQSPVKKKLKIEQATVDAFSRKLKEWSKTLPQEERKLVRLLVDRATAVNVGDLGGYNLKANIRPEAEKLFKTLRRAIQSSPAVGGVNLEPGDITWFRTMITTPNWKNASSTRVNPPATRTRGGGNQ